MSSKKRKKRKKGSPIRFGIDDGGYLHIDLVSEKKLKP
jgi:hypothetical protein